MAKGSNGARFQGCIRLEAGNCDRIERTRPVYDSGCEYNEEETKAVTNSLYIIMRTRVFLWYVNVNRWCGLNGEARSGFVSDGPYEQ